MEPEQLKNLIFLRECWEEAANGASLLDLKGPVGLMLHDVAGALFLEPADRLAFLGDRLAAEVEEFISSPLQLERQVSVNLEAERPRVTVSRGTTTRRYWPKRASLERLMQLLAG